MIILRKSDSLIVRGAELSKIKPRTAAAASGGTRISLSRRLLAITSKRPTASVCGASERTFARDEVTSAMLRD